MTANQEIVAYLEDLLDHEAGCEAENCPRCESLRAICQAVRNTIFAEVMFPQVTIAARNQVCERELPAAGGAAASLPRAA